MKPDSPQQVPQPPPATAATGRPQQGISLGVVLALIGIGCDAVAVAVPYLTRNPSGTSLNDLISRIRIQTAAWATGSALAGVGLFLVFFNVVRIRPATKLWTIGAAVVILAAGAASAVLRVLWFQTYSSLIEGANFTTLGEMLDTINVIASAVALAGSTATILGLFGLTRSLLSH
jgi:hypothetical protein